MNVFLNYVNKADTTVELDKYFDNLLDVPAWVNKHHPEWTSYDVIVLRPKEDAQ